MKIREVMTNPAIRVSPEESAAVAARLFARYNVGALPVCGSDGRVCGMVTDRDLVTRCVASGRTPEHTPVSQVMTPQVISVRPDTEVTAAASLMGTRQVRRLPVVENGRLCGMVSLADLAHWEDSSGDAADALARISSNVSDPEGHL